MKRIISFYVIGIFLFSGCATGTLERVETKADGSSTKFKANIQAVLMDSKTTDLNVVLDPDKKSTIKAGAIDQTVSPVAVDAMSNFVETLKALKEAGLLATPGVK